MPAGLFLGATYAVFILKRFFSVVVMRYNRKGAVGRSGRYGNIWDQSLDFG
jgi:hypothetical protein